MVNQVPDQCFHKWVEEEHTEECADTNNPKPLVTFLRTDSRDKSQRQPSKAPSNKATQSVGEQIVDIRRPKGENLQYFHESWQAKSKQYGRPKFTKCAPEQGQKEAERHKKDYIQKAVGKIGKHIGKGPKINIGMKPNITDIRQPYYGKHSAQVDGKGRVTHSPFAVMEEFPA